MSMADDYRRLEQLEQVKGTLQYGQNLTVLPGSSNPDLVLASKDLVRFVGEKTDVNAWRVYLGPWQPSPQILVDPAFATATYADPTPWAPPEPRTFDSFLPIPAYARVLWGSGGIQHQAFVDWPKRGLKLQISGNYVQVNAFVDTLSPGVDARLLPLLQATLGPDPGTGPVGIGLGATFTYATEFVPVVAGRQIQFFQIPPFARAFVPLLQFANATLFPGTQYIIETKIQPLAAARSEQSWITPVPALGGAFDQSFTRDPFPIVGQEAGVVQITKIGGDPTEQFGVMFLLDL